VPVEQLVNGRVGARVAPLVHLASEPAKNLVGRSLGAMASGHGLAEVVPAPSERIDAGVCTHPESTAGKRLDGAALAAGATRARTRHDRSA
jgi:hypothetical protein